MPTPLKMPLSSDEIARKDPVSGRTEFRADAVRVRVALDDGLTTSDRHELRCAFECSVRVADARADRELFEEVLLGSGRYRIQDRDAAEHLSRRMRDDVAAFVAKRPADELAAGGETRTALTEALRKSADAAAFACGLIVMPPFSLDVESPSLQRQKLEAMQRQRAEERAAGQVEHLRRAGELLKQFQSIRESTGGIAPGAVLQQIAPADRGSTLEALLLASSRQDKQATLYAVSGPFLVRIDTTSESPRADLINLPDALGPLRSIQPAAIDGRELLLVGARAGVMLVDPNAPTEAKTYAAPSSESHLGFNRAVTDGRTIWATHGDQGLLAWDVESKELKSSHAASGARNLQLLGASRRIFSSGSSVFVTDSEDAPQTVGAGSSSEVIAIVSDSARAFVIRENGNIVTLDATTRAVLDDTTRAGRVCAAAALPFLGSLRLLLAREDGPIECVGVDDQLVTQYLSAHRSYRILAASADLVAAVSSDRQRLILWRAWDGRKPFAEIHLTGQTRHRIADIDFA